MNLAAWRFPVSIRHDVVIPALIVLGLWATGAWYYHLNTFSGGAIATPDQAIEVAKRICGQRADPIWQGQRMRAHLKNGFWFVDSQVYDYTRLRTAGIFASAIDAQTGQVRECRIGVID